MKFARKILYSIGSLLVLMIVVGVFLPAKTRIERAVLIDAWPATIFALLNDVEQTRKWSPWINADPNTRYEISGPRRGRGASVRWNGNIVGNGAQTIVESMPYERVVSQLELGNRNLALSTISLTKSGDDTETSWVLERNFGINLFGRYLGLMLDGIVGDELETGLKNLKNMAESLPRADFSDLEIEEIVVEASDMAFLTATSVPEAEAISEATAAAYFSILRFIDTHGLQEAGAPIIISRGFSGSKLTFDAAIPVRGNATPKPPANGKVRLGRTYAGTVIRARHVGSYANLARTHDKIAAYLAAFGIERNGDAWESYVSDPTRTPEAELLTYVYYPVRR